MGNFEGWVILKGRILGEKGPVFKLENLACGLESVHSALSLSTGSGYCGVCHWYLHCGGRAELFLRDGE